MSTISDVDAAMTQLVQDIVNGTKAAFRVSGIGGEISVWHVKDGDGWEIRWFWRGLLAAGLHQDSIHAKSGASKILHPSDLLFDAQHGRTVQRVLARLGA